MAKTITIRRLAVDMLYNPSAFEQGIKQTQKSLNQVGRQFTQIGAGLTKTITLPIVAIGGAAFKAADDMDKAMRKIRAGTGATGEDLDGLGKDFRAVLAKVPQDTTQVAAAIADLNTRTGQTGESLQILTKQLLDVSRVTGTDVSSNVAGVTRVFGDWGTAVEKQGDTLDYLFKVSQNTGIGIEQLSRNLVMYGAPLRQMGFDFETAAALMGKFEKEGVNTELVLGSLRIALGKMAKAGIQDTNAALTELINQIKTTGSTGEANAKAIAVFGSRAGPDMAAAIREGRFDLDELLKTLAASPETIDKAANATLSFSERLGILWNKVKLALAPLGRVLLDIFENTISPALETLVGYLQKAAAWFSNLSKPMQLTIVAVAAVAAALGPLLLVFGQLAFALSGVIGILPVLATVFGAIVSPVGLVVAAVGGAALLIWKNWDTVGPMLIGLWNKIKETAAQIAAAISKVWDEHKDKIMLVWNQVKDFLSQVWSSLGNVAQLAFGVLGSVISGALDTIIGWVQIFAGALTLDFGMMWDGVKSIFRGAVNAISGIFSAFWEFLLRQASDSMGLILGQFQRLSEYLPGWAQRALGIVGEFGQGLKDNVDAQIAAIEAGRKKFVESTEEQGKAAETTGSALDKLTGIFKGVGGGAALAGTDLAGLNNLLDGTKEKGDKVAETMKKMRQATLDFLPPFSAFQRQVAAGTTKVETFGDFIDRQAEKMKDANVQIQYSTAAHIQNTETLWDTESALEENIRGLEEKADAMGKDTARVVENSQFSQEWSSAWSNAMGNVLDRFTTWASDMLGISNGFVKSLFEIFVQQLFNPLFSWFGKLTGAFGNWLGSLLPGGGSFSLGGALKSALGIGTAVATTGGAAAAAGTVAGVGFGGGLTAAQGIGVGFGPAGFSAGLGAEAGTAAGSSFLSSFGALLTNPWTIGIGAAIGAGLLIKKFWPKSAWEKTANEIGRDFGVEVTKGTVESFGKGIGLSKSAIEGIRKDISSSPKFFQEILLPAAQMTGTVDQLVASYGKLEAFGKVWNLQAEAAKAAEGDFSGLNAAWVKLFEQSQRLQEALPNWREILLGISDAADEAAESVNQLADAASQTSAAVNLGEERVLNRGAGYTQKVEGGRKVGLSGPYAEAMRYYKSTGKWPTWDDLIAAGIVKSYQKGGFVSQTGPAYLHAGEMVMDYDRLEGIFSRNQQQQPSVNYLTVNISSRSEDLVRTTKQDVIPILQRELMKNTSGLTRATVQAVRNNDLGVLHRR